MYAVVKGLKINWASLIYSIMKTRPTTFLPYGKSVTIILRAFQVSLIGSTRLVYTGTTDYTTVKRMKLEDGDKREDNQESQTQPQDLPSSSTTTRAKITIENVYAEQVLIRAEPKKKFEFVEKVSEKVDSMFEEIIAQISSLKSEKTSTQEEVQKENISKGKELMVIEDQTELDQTETIVNEEQSSLGKQTESVINEFQTEPVINEEPSGLKVRTQGEQEK